MLCDRFSKESRTMNPLEQQNAALVCEDQGMKSGGLMIRVDKLSENIRALIMLAAWLSNW